MISLKNRRKSFFDIPKVSIFLDRTSIYDTVLHVTVFNADSELTVNASECSGVNDTLTTEAILTH